MPQQGQINYPDFAAIFNSAANFRRMQMEEDKMAAAKSAEERDRLLQQKTAAQWRKASAEALKTGDAMAAAQHIEDPATQAQFLPKMQGALAQRKERADTMTLAGSQVLEQSAAQLAEANYDDSVHHRIAYNINKEERAGRIPQGSLRRWMQAGEASRKQRQAVLQQGGFEEGAMAKAAAPVFDELVKGVQLERAGLVEEKVSKMLGFMDADEKGAASTFIPAHPELQGLPAAQAAAAVRAHPEWLPYLQKYKADERAAALAGRKAGAAKIINMPPGNTPIEKGTKLTLESSILSMQDAQQKIELLKSMARPEFFGLEGDVRGTGAKIIDYFAGDATPESIAAYTEQKQWLTSFGRIFVLDLLTSKSGKQVTDKEREFLLKAVGDPDNMTFHQYKGAISAMERMMNDQMGIATTGIREGIDVLTGGQRKARDAELLRIAKGLDAGTMDQDEGTRRLVELRKELNMRIALKDREMQDKQSVSRGAAKLKADVEAGRIEEGSQEYRDRLAELQEKAGGL